MDKDKETYKKLDGPVDRDLHATRNILRAGCPEIKPVETVEDFACKATV